MSYRIEFHPLASEELDDAYQWYEDRSRGLGSRLIEKVEEALSILSNQPYSRGKKLREYREFRIDTFPYLLVYEVLEKQKLVFISYVFHTSRNPKLKYKR